MYKFQGGTALKIDLVSGVYFSPTGNTAKVVNAIGNRIAGDYYKEIDNGQYEYINCVKYTDPKTNEDILFSN